MKIVFFVLAGIIASFFFYEEARITSILSYHDKGIFTSFAPGPITAGKKVQGSFVATNDNLGTVKFRIQTFNRMNTSRITFALKEKTNTDWLAVNTYATDRFVDGLLYPFGFPPITNSKEKTYVFELSSQDGNPDNAIGLTSAYHAVASQYVFTKNVLLAQPNQAAIFVKEKIKSMILDPYVWLYEMMFFIPALSLFVKRKIIPLAYLVLTYAYLPVDMHSNMILYVAAAGLFVAYLANVSSRAAFATGFLCLLQIPLAVALGNALAASRLATLVFFSLASGAMMAWRELKNYQHV